MTNHTNDDTAAPAHRAIDDFATDDLVAAGGARWRAVSDRVMGGVSRGQIRALPIDAVGAATAAGGDPARPHRHAADSAAGYCLHLTGRVSLENNGGFIQAALDLCADGGVLDASRYTGVRLRVAGNGEQYVAGLRTPDCVRPWQSYRASFVAQPDWRDVTLRFSDFEAHRLERPLDTSRLRRLGLLAIGREFRADLYVAGVWLYPD